MINANLLEQLSTDLSKSVNPIRFAQSLGFKLDAWQRNLLLSNNKRVLLLAARQVGKSTASSILALHYSLNNPDSLVLVLSPSLRQSGELFKCIIRFYRDAGRPVPPETETALALKMTNGSRIVSLPSNESTIRGFSGVNLVIIDEAALVPDSLYLSVRPMLAVSEGRLIALGTPHGCRGWFYETWANSDEFKKIKITADQCPRISNEFLEQERKALGQYWYKQEYFCEFHQNEASLFHYDVIRRAIRDDIEELDFDLDL
ncbi:MAG: terminase large subunit domain-containing protein [Halobacteriota archaeon]